MSIPPAEAPKSLSALFSVYGVVVRPNGISVMRPAPAGVTESDFSPSTVVVRIAAND
ncbi:Uncharacterised protein [Mycobacteroides abscessus subsp. abscessus]|nr:Uncharacterised protein [Mycobacteroides abscessus subsp. abscessus]SKS47722.1 Uncharacterised protein [Mycobacteroides abscessus subsp. abscessus]